MTIKALFPTVRPTLNLDFAKTKALDPRVTFTRATSGTYVGADGLIKTAAANVPRFDHNPATGESLGLLVEEARTNLITYSEQFDNAAWTKDSCSITANATTAPDGTATADKYVEGTSVYNLVSATTGSSATSTAYTATVYVKAAERSACYIRLAYTGNANWVSGKYDLINGVAQVSTGSASTYTNASVSIQACSNGWWRITCTCTGSNMTPRWGAMDSYSTTINASSGVPFYTGNGTSGIYIWGAQLEAGSTASSYIPTGASGVVTPGYAAPTVTRAADVASITGTNFSSWYNQNAGSMFGSFVSLNNDSNASLASLYQTSSQSAYRISLRVGNSFAQTNSVTQFSFPTSYTKNQTTKVAWGFDSTATYYKNATLIGTDSSVTMPTTLDGMVIGQVEASANIWINGTIARLAFYPVRLPDAQLQALTAT